MGGGNDDRSTRTRMLWVCGSVSLCHTSFSSSQVPDSLKVETRKWEATVLEARIGYKGGWGRCLPVGRIRVLPRRTARTYGSLKADIDRPGW